MDHYSQVPSRPYGPQTTPLSQQQRLEPIQPEQQLPSIREVIPPVRSNAMDNTPMHEPSNGRTMAMPYLSSQSNSGISAMPAPIPVQPQTSTMTFSAETGNALHLNSLGANLNVQTPSRSPAEYSSPWSSSSGYQEPQVLSSTQPSLPSQHQAYSSLVPSSVSSESDMSNLSFSSSYSSLSRPMPVLESPSSDTYSRWRAPQATPSQRYNPYLLSERNYNQSSLYSQPSYDSYRSNLNYDTSYRPLDTSPYSMRYNQLLSYPIMGYPSHAHGRRRRGNLPKQITDILRLWLQEHIDHPYPSDEQKQVFIQRTGLSISQISNWFINARRRQLPAMKLKRAKLISSRA